MHCRQLHRLLLLHSARRPSGLASAHRLAPSPTPEGMSARRHLSAFSAQTASQTMRAAAEHQEAADEKPTRVRRKAASAFASGMREHQTTASAVFSPPAVDVEVEEATDGKKTRRTARRSRKDSQHEVVVEATTSPQSAASASPPPAPPASSSPRESFSHTPASVPRQRSLLARQRSPGFSPFVSTSADAASPSSFGIQRVLSLLYSYLPPPPSSPPSAPPAAASSAVAAAPSLPHPVSVYDVSSRSIFSDFIVVVQTHSSRQMRFLAFALHRAARDADACRRNRSTLSIERRNADDWTLVDIGHCIVHLFNSQAPLPRPGLDFHPSHLLALGDDDSQQAAAAEAGTVHPVITSIVTHFGDLLVPPSAHALLRDGGHGGGSRGGAEEGDAVRLVQDVSDRTVAS